MFLHKKGNDDQNSCRLSFCQSTQLYLYILFGGLICNKTSDFIRSLYVLCAEILIGKETNCSEVKNTIPPSEDSRQTQVQASNL